MCDSFLDLRTKFYFHHTWKKHFIHFFEKKLTLYFFLLLLQGKNFPRNGSNLKAFTFKFFIKLFQDWESRRNLEILHHCKKFRTSFISELGLVEISRFKNIFHFPSFDNSQTLYPILPIFLSSSSDLFLRGFKTIWEY